MVGYNIPNQNNQMYKTSPAWSIMGKHPRGVKPKGPGPSTYTPDCWNSKHIPSWKIGTQLRRASRQQQFPGPAQYSTSYHPKSTKFGIINSCTVEKTKKTKEKSPSPAEYSPQYNKFCSSSFSIRGKQKSQSMFQGPGPGAYQRKSDSFAKGILINKQSRFAVGRDKGSPGPGSYEPSRATSARIGFTRQPRMTGAEQNINKPGPGAYALTSLFDQSATSKKGFSLGLRQQTINKDKQPGPSDYNPDAGFSATHLSTPYYSISKRVMPTKSSISPSPAEYSPVTPKVNNFATFGQAARPPLNERNDSPGPANYDSVQPSRPASPKYSIGKSRKEEGIDDVPGPGCYSPNKNYVKNRPQSAQIGKSCYGGFNKENNPGPGTYGDASTTAYKFAYTKDKRFRDRVQVIPGPGEYPIKSSVAYTAPYALK